MAKLNQAQTIAFSKIYSLGASRGDLTVTNDDIAGPINSSDEWIRQRTGIITRMRASKNRSLMDMAVEASNEAIAKAGIKPSEIEAAKARALPAIRGALAGNPVKARITVSGYEGSELLVARLLIEAGAEVPYVGTAAPRTEWSAADREWLEAHGCHVQYRASLEQDIAAMKEARPDLALGTTPLVQKAKEMGTPALYFTNMISARPLFGPAGAASMAGIVAAQTNGRERFSRMVSFFEGVGTPDGAGYGFRDKPSDPPGFRDRQRKLRAAKAKAEEAVGT